MADFLMPSLGADMEVGTVLQWLVKPGDAVKRGDIVAVVDTEKATIEVEIFQTGVIQKIVVPEGEKVPVGTLLAVLAVDGEVVGGDSRGQSPNPSPASAPPRHRCRSLRAPRRCREAPLAEVRRRPRMHISPLAMRVALDLKVDLTTVKGTGPDGAITKADVERAAKAPPTPAHAPPFAAAVEAPAPAQACETGRRTNRPSCGDA